MNNWNPYAPDPNPPPGIPKGYPYALNPNPPNANPMGSPGFPMQNYPPGNPNYGHNTSSYPAGNGSPYPNMSFPNSAGSPYPPSSSPYPAVSPNPSGSPYPAGSSPYPSGSSPYPSGSSNPSGSPYPAGSSPYPSGSSPYPSGSSNPSGSPYPTGSSPYPAAGSSPYPGVSQNPSGSPYPAGSSLYPTGGSSMYPGVSPNPSGSPYPAAGSSPYPGVSPNPSGSPNPTGSSPYPARSSPYPATGSSLYPAASPNSSGPSDPSRSYPTSRQLPNMANYLGEGTVKSYPNFDPRIDAEALRKAMKGFGTDEKAIISVLANRDNAQRVYIGVAFKQLYGKDLIDDLKSELSGNFEQVILALMMPTHDYLASELHKAISGIGTDEDVLIEVLCSRTNQEIWAINEAYTRLFGKSLESDIKGDTSGHFQRLLVSTCTGCRSEEPADSMRAKQTAEALYQAGAAQWGTDESVFNSILVAESLQQLAHTFYEYQKLTGKTVSQAIEGEMSGDLKKGMLTIAKCVENRPLFFAEKLYKAMKGLGTDDNTLIRIVVSRCEIDMVQIKAEYERNYGKPLADAIKGDTSGDYKKVLLALVN